MDARALRWDADATFGDFEQVDLDHAAGQETVGGREALPSGFALGGLEFDCRRSSSSDCSAILATDGRGRDR
jgi:hypothetical protein